MGQATERASHTLPAPKISLVFAYYENPHMLALQWGEISKYPQSLKNLIEVVVVDDASPASPAADVERPGDLPRHSIFRIVRDIRWNQDAARNIGAHEATSALLLLTDIDHVVPPATLERLLTMDLDAGAFYSLGRIKYENSDPRESHPNSYVMSRDLYWKIGGHDEDFAGIYGKDFLFRKRAKQNANEVSLEHLKLARVGSGTVLDAGTSTITRRNSVRQRVWGYVLEYLKKLRLWRGVQTLSYEYKKAV